MSSSRLCRLTTRQNALLGETRLESISVCPKLLSALQPTSPTQLHNIILKYHWIKTSKVNVNLNAERKAESVESRLADVIRDLNASRNDVYFVQCREFRGRRTHEFARSARRAFHARRLIRLTFRLSMFRLPRQTAQISSSAIPNHGYILHRRGNFQGFAVLHRRKMRVNTGNCRI